EARRCGSELPEAGCAVNLSYGWPLTAGEPGDQAYERDSAEDASCWFGGWGGGEGEVAPGYVQAGWGTGEGHRGPRPALRGGLCGELVDVAHGVAGLECAQSDIRGHRLHVKPRVEWINEFEYERVLEQLLRTIVDANKLVVREVLERPGAGWKLRLERAHAEF